MPVYRCPDPTCKVVFTKVTKFDQHRASTNHSPGASLKTCPVTAFQCQKCKTKFKEWKECSKHILQLKHGAANDPASCVVPSAKSVPLVPVMPVGSLPPCTSQPAPSPSWILIETSNAVKRLCSSGGIWEGTLNAIVAIDIVGASDSISLMQLSVAEMPMTTYIFDAIAIGPGVLCKALAPLLQSTSVVKLIHDLHCHAMALWTIGKIRLDGVIDTQLVFENMEGSWAAGLSDVLEHWHPAGKQHPTDVAVRPKIDPCGVHSKTRPIVLSVLKYAALNVKLLANCADIIINAISDNMELMKAASQRRVDLSIANGAIRSIWFDGRGRPSSVELLCVVHDIHPARSSPADQDLAPLLAILPDRFQVGVSLSDTDLVDIVMDIGRPAQAYCFRSGRRVLLPDHTEAVVTRADIDDAISRIGEFGSDNRAGISGRLDRISAMRNRSGEVIGLTLRVGRSVPGHSDLIRDLAALDKSILLLGVPGSGKTTMLRDLARALSTADQNVCIVDTSNEIGGDGDVPHSCIGDARRMMVPSLNQQHRVMVECVQNHTIDVMVIDEIGRSAEVAAARTVRQRGVRVIASAHGDLGSLIKNQELRGLIGGIENVTVGDAMAKLSRSGSKVVAQRAGAPTFDIIVEILSRNECRVVMDVARAVDDILAGNASSVIVQKRTRDHNDGAIRLQIVRV